MAISPETASYVSVEIRAAGRHIWGVVALPVFGLWPVGCVAGVLMVRNLLRLGRASVGKRWTQLLTVVAALAGVAGTAWSVAWGAVQWGFQDLVSFGTVLAPAGLVVTSSTSGLIALSLFVRAATRLDDGLDRRNRSWRGALLPACLATTSSFVHAAATVSGRPSLASVASAVALLLLVVTLVRLAWAQESTLESLDDLYRVRGTSIPEQPSRWFMRWSRHATSAVRWRRIR